MRTTARAPSSLLRSSALPEACAVTLPPLPAAAQASPRASGALAAAAWEVQQQHQAAAQQAEGTGAAGGRGAGGGRVGVIPSYSSFLLLRA